MDYVLFDGHRWQARLDDLLGELARHHVEDAPAAMAEAMLAWSGYRWR